MDKLLFTDLLCAALAVMLLWAAVVDIRTRTIANGLNLAIALMAPLFWWAAGVDLWPDAAIRVGVAAAVFLLLALAFYAGAMGGGDVKLAAALALWFSPASTLKLLVLMSLAGGLLTLIVMIEHKYKKNEGRPEVPYGVAIAFGGLWLLAQRFLNHFA
ncbi:MAG TPA: prepilin peptidase [Sphingomicrobium sp.]|jgi:prepilin peptidase CpaA|nr:prepilin peptidase [Sphingomicrobium sp.]